MVKKNSKYRKPKKPAKKISLRKESNISHLNKSKKITLKKSKSVSNDPPKNQKSNLKEKNGNNSELITQSFFDAQSSIKLQCCFCSKSLNNSIKVILEPFPKNTKENFNFIKKSFLPFEVSCLKCFIIKAKINNLKKIESQNYFYNDTPHQYTDYHIISKMTEPIFTDDWTFGDEIKLLGALSHLGIGNWEDISNVLGKDKNSSFSNKNGDNKESVDKNSDLLEADDDISDDIDILYSESNLSSRKNRSSSKKANSKDSADDPEEYAPDESFDSSFDESISSDENSDDFSDDGLDDVNSLESASSDDEVEKMSNLKDKYAKYDFTEDSDEDSKPKFKKSVDFDKIQEELSEEQLEAQKQKRKEELAIKKRRIIQGTNFDNSLRKK